jgi:hypothetical protein
MIWTDEDKLRVVGLWREGLSAAQVAAEFNSTGHDVTRNAVIGQLKRLGESELTRDKRARRGPARSMKSAGDYYSGVVLEPAAACDPVSFDALEQHHCRFPVSGDGAEMLYCGSPRQIGSYCEPHYRKATGGRNR